MALSSSIINTMESISNSDTYFSVEPPTQLLSELDNSWELWTLLREISLKKLYPSSNFVASSNIKESYDKAKSKSYPIRDRFYYALEFIGFQNNIVYKQVHEIIVKGLEGVGKE